MNNTVFNKDWIIMVCNLCCLSTSAMVIGIVAAWCGLGLLPVSLVCCATVLILEHFIV